MPKHVLIVSSAEDGEHRGFVEYEVESQLGYLALESFGKRLGNQYIHTVTLQHEGPKPGDQVYTFEMWMHAVSMAKAA